MRWIWIGFITTLCACGGTGQPAESGADAASGKGAQCIEQARAPREKKADEPLRIEVSHILVRHRDLERPQGATRTPEEACLRALEALNALKSGGQWDQVVDQYSDAKGATHGGLGRLSRDDMDPAFADAAFALDVDELSYVVETERGFHIILRTE